MAISETCACEDSTYNYGITGYEVFHTTRNHRNGGGVACYVNNDLACKFIPQKSFAIDDVLECVTIEIVISGLKNTIVHCLYRTLGSNVVAFLEHLELSVIDLAMQKTLIVCGDFNITC